MSETTAPGAAYAAGLAACVWGSRDALRRHWQVDRTFEPRIPAAVRDTGYAAWKRAVERSRGWLPDASPASVQKENMG